MLHINTVSINAADIPVTPTSFLLSCSWLMLVVLNLWKKSGGPVHWKATY